MKNLHLPSCQSSPVTQMKSPMSSSLSLDGLNPTSTLDFAWSHLSPLQKSSSSMRSSQKQWIVISNSSFRHNYPTLSKAEVTDLTENWPSPSDVEILDKKAAGFFIYASTVVKFVTSGIGLSTERLALITSLPLSTTEERKSGVDQLYTKVLEQAFHGIHTDSSQPYLNFRTVVGTILLLLNPLSIKGLSELLRYHTSHICNIIYSLHSLLVPDSTEDPILTIHKSFPDFLIDPEWCKDKQFLVEPSVQHAEILLSCLNLMKKG